MAIAKFTNQSTLFSKLQLRKKYIKNEFQAYALELAEELEDIKHKTIYMRLAKYQPREILEKARLFVKDQNFGVVKNKAKLFMWKLKELRKVV